MKNLSAKPSLPFATKFANEFGPIGENLGLNSRCEHINAAVEGFMPKHRAHRFVRHADLGGDLS